MKRKAPIACLIFFLFVHAGYANPTAKEVVASARSQIGVTTQYDPAYVSLAYPGGDVPKHTGVCTDVVVRTFRKFNYDLQKLVHEDMKSAFASYPQNWGLKRPDSNIDHRRVPNLMKFFGRHGVTLKHTKDPQDYRPGDIVAWNLGSGTLHIGLVSDRKGSNGNPLIIHNIGGGAQEEDILFQYKIIGHYRYRTES